MVGGIGEALEACEEGIQSYERRLKGEHHGTAMIKLAGNLEERMNQRVFAQSCQLCTSNLLAWIRVDMRGLQTKGRNLTSTFAPLTPLVADVLTHPPAAREGQLAL